MSSKTDVQLTPGERLTRGLKYTAVGPVDVTRGTVGLSWQGAHSAADSIRKRVERSRLAKEIGDAQESIAQEIDYVDNEVTLFGRRYFEVRPKTPGASYRVTVHSGDWTRST